MGIRAAAVQVATVQVAGHQAAEVVRVADLPPAADAPRSRDELFSDPALLSTVAVN